MHLTAIGNALPLTQCARIMKLTALFFIIGLLQVSAHSTAQVTLKENAASLEKVLVAIKQQSGYDLFFNRSILKAKARPVIVDVNNVPVEQALKAVFKNQDQLTYSLNGNIISVKEKSEKKLDPLTEGLNPRLEPFPPPTVHGRITNEKGEAVAGVSISIKGGKTIGVTNDDGMFTLTNVPDNAILVFSAVNVETREVALNGRVEVNLGLKSKVSVLDEVQMIAYGSTSKRLQTGNISSVKAADIEKQPVNNPLLALQGRVPGLFITQSNGLPGSGVTVRIQGQNSIGKGNDPLYVIDGIPYTPQLLPSITSILGSSGGIQGPGNGNNGSPFSYINPADIESIDVLKDADATAIYGSRAANGAILITTKKGKAGQTKVDINVQNGWGKVTRKLDVLNTRQYLDMRYEAYSNDGITTIPATAYDLKLWDTTRYTDWQKELIGGTAHFTDIQTTASGGNANTQFLIGTGYHKETTVFPGDQSDQKGSLHFNINNVSTNQKFRIQLTGSYLFDNNRLTITDFTNMAIRLAPNAPPLFNADGSLNWMPNASGTSTWTNPLAHLYRIYKNKSTNLVSSFILSYQVLHGLEIKSSFGYTNLQSNENYIQPLFFNAPEKRATSTRTALYGNNNINSWIIEPQAEYKRAIGNGRLEVLIGTTIQQNRNNGTQLLGKVYNNDAVMEDIRSAATITVNSTTISTYKYNALFGRINYNWQNKYILNLTGRRDGSSRFGAKNQFHNFGSVGSSWIFSSEKFIQQKLRFISFGKLRCSYGTTGNDQIDNYLFMNLYNAIGGTLPYQGTTGLEPVGLPNPYLKWEETKKLQFGLDFGIFKDRILLGVNYFYNRSSNQLLDYSLPIVTGFTGIARNFPATVQNTGWEVSINTTNLKGKNLSWTSNINFTVPRNKLVDFPNLATSSYTQLVIGEPISIQRAFLFSGVNTTTGIYQFIDNNGNNTSSPNSSTDMTAIINTAPKFYGSFQNTIQYKEFELDILFQFTKQIGPNYFLGFFPGSSGTLTNQPTTVLSRWQKQGDITSIQRYNSNSSLFSQASNALSSDGSYSDASYIRLKNLSLSWQVPEAWSKKCHLQNCRLYMHGQNLLTITNYKGMDPENYTTTSLPPLRVLTLGIQIGL